MNMEMNVNTLVVAVYARAAMDRAAAAPTNTSTDLGVAKTKIKNNIVVGRAVDPVVGIPAEYMPDYAAWNAVHNNMGHDDFIDEWNAMCEKIDAIGTKRLSQMFENKQYDEMIHALDTYVPAEDV